MVREREPIEFRPIPGLEEDWAGASDYEMMPIMLWLGAYPILIYVAAIGFLIGLT